MKPAPTEPPFPVACIYHSYHLEAPPCRVLDPDRVHLLGLTVQNRQD